MWFLSFRGAVVSAYIAVALAAPARERSPNPCISGSVVTDDIATDITCDTSVTTEPGTPQLLAGQSNQRTVSFKQESAVTPLTYVMQTLANFHKATEQDLEALQTNVKTYLAKSVAAGSQAKKAKTKTEHSSVASGATIISSTAPEIFAQLQSTRVFDLVNSANGLTTGRLTQLFLQFQTSRVISGSNVVITLDNAAAAQKQLAQSSAGSKSRLSKDT